MRTIWCHNAASEGFCGEFSFAGFPCRTASRDGNRDVMELRRARPLLGTLVEIVAGGLPEPQLTAAINGGFSEVARVHRLMSAHDHRSDIGRLNRLAHRTAVRVHPWTWRVLRFAQTIADRTNGIF